jgi:hypothetical protein
MTLEDLIKQKVPFTKTSGSGFNQCICAVCNDHSPRGGFKFELGTIGYNCFNCGTGAKYQDDQKTISRKFRKILNAFAISDDEIDSIINKAFFMKAEEKATVSLSDLTPEKKNYLITPEIQFPKSCFRLGETDRSIDQQLEIAEYLTKRKIDIDQYPFYFSLTPKLIGYVIIPFFRNGKLIYWQGRSIKADSDKSRYENCTQSKENIIFNFDQLFNGVSPLFVTEGVFDAMPLNGIAIIGGKLNEAKIEVLRKSRRRLIFVIDKDKNGKMVAQKAIENGWEITFSPSFTSDVNDSIIKYGRCWTIHQLFKSIPADALSTKTQIELNCR